MRRRHYRGQALFQWETIQEIRPLHELLAVAEPESKTSSDLYDTSAIRTRAQCAAIMTMLEGKTVTESMVRTAEDKALDKIAAFMRRSEIGNLILTAQPGTVEFDVIREALTDIARES